MGEDIRTFMQDALNQREHLKNRRRLKIRDGVDFCSNDYLGLARIALPVLQNGPQNGSPDGHQTKQSTSSTGSRLISGDHHNLRACEDNIARFHKCEAALLFSSGYQANIGLLSALGQAGDIFICDEYIHASLIDGARLSRADRLIFKHNDINDLEKNLKQAKDRLCTAKSQGNQGRIFIIAEALYSMDGDLAPLQEISHLCEAYKANLIIDEAHSIGIYGEHGQGRANALGLSDKVLATIYTYGKAPGFHGAAIAGSALLKDYLINFCRSFIYTTAPSPQYAQDLITVYQRMEKADEARHKLTENIDYFRSLIGSNSPVKLQGHWIESQSPVQGFIYPGNEKIKILDAHLAKSGFAIKAILSPTVPAGQERLRINIHAHNSFDDIKALVRDIHHFSQNLHQTSSRDMQE